VLSTAALTTEDAPRRLACSCRCRFSPRRTSCWLCRKPSSRRMIVCEPRLRPVSLVRAMRRLRKGGGGVNAGVCCTGREGICALPVGVGRPARRATAVRGCRARGGPLHDRGGQARTATAANPAPLRGLDPAVPRSIRGPAAGALLLHLARAEDASHATTAVGRRTRQRRPDFH
jgi:hypothetical protein